MHVYLVILAKKPCNADQIPAQTTTSHLNLLRIDDMTGESIGSFTKYPNTIPVTLNVFLMVETISEWTSRSFALVDKRWLNCSDSNSLPS